MVKRVLKEDRISPRTDHIYWSLSYCGRSNLVWIGWKSGQAPARVVESIYWVHICCCSIVFMVKLRDVYSITSLIQSASLGRVPKSQSFPGFRVPCLMVRSHMAKLYEIYPEIERNRVVFRIRFQDMTSETLLFIHYIYVMFSLIP